VWSFLGLDHAEDQPHDRHHDRQHGSGAQHSSGAQHGSGAPTLGNKATRTCWHDCGVPKSSLDEDSLSPQVWRELRALYARGRSNLGAGAGWRTLEAAAGSHD
jgi:hypothetical protein